jgi:dienelactone hydrolase
MKIRVVPVMIFVALQCGVLGGCGEEASDDAVVPQGVCPSAYSPILPALTGPYCVGERLMALRDPHRDEPFTSDPGDYREVLVHLFYPIDQGTDGEPAPYVTEQATLDWLITLAPPGDYENFDSNSLLDAPLASGRRAFPLLLLSPGLGVVTELQTTMAENLASHGYVVAAINHPYVSGMTTFPDGRAVPQDPRLAALNLPFLTERFPILVTDQMFVLDRLETLAADDPMWRNRIDFDRVGSLGHSLGGATAAAICLADPRVRACINYDGQFFGDILTEGTDKPLMVMLSEGSPLPNLSAVIAHHTGPLHTVQVTGAFHNGFATDIGIVNGHFAPSFPNWALVGTMAPERLVALTNAYNLSFFGVYLQDHPLTELTDLTRSFPEARFETPS